MILFNFKIVYKAKAYFSGKHIFDLILINARQIFMSMSCI